LVNDILLLGEFLKWRRGPAAAQGLRADGAVNLPHCGNPKAAFEPGANAAVSRRFGSTDRFKQSCAKQRRIHVKKLLL
jgi:hypothetical protein